MKYKIFNNKITGGDIPKFNIPIEGLESKQLMNAKGPLYFNLNKNPIKALNNSYYQYDYTYEPDSTLYQIDSNLNLNPSVQTSTILQSDNLYANRIINVNDLEIPYYLGKSHTNRKFFGRIKFLFQYVHVITSESDPTQKRIIPIKKEDDIIGLIEGMFNISDEFQQLIQINQRLENPIDKYIFINKFYELLEIITWKMPIIDLKFISKIKIGSISFKNIPIETKTTSSGKLVDIIKKNNFKSLIDYYMKGKDGFQVKFYIKLLCKLEKKEQIQYVKMLTKIDYILTKLKSIFKDENDVDETKINLYNLIDLYAGYNKVFLNETRVNQQPKTIEVDPEIIKSQLIETNIKSINAVNTKPKINFNQLLANQVIELINLKNVLDKIKNWPITYDTQDVDLHMILLLSYFDLRVGNPQIKQGINLNAIPINRNEALANLFDNGRSSESTNEILINTEKYLADKSLGPNIVKETPYTYIAEYDLRFPACVENTILQFVKFLFWNYDTNQYDINTLTLGSNNFMKKFMEEYIKSDKQTEDVINNFIKPLINLPNINYVHEIKGIKYELNALASNVLRIILFLLQTDESNILTNPVISGENNKNILDQINKILSSINYTLELDESGSRIGIINLKKIKEDIVVLKLELHTDAHGEASKSIDSSINMELVKSTKIYKLLVYLTHTVSPDIHRTNPNYCPKLIDFVKFRGLKSNIASKYFNTNNIYWLNFIKQFDNFYSDCIEYELKPNLIDLGFDDEIILKDYVYSFLIKLSRIIFDIITKKYNSKINNTILNTNLFSTFFYLILISRIDLDSNYLTLFNQVQDFKFNPNDLDDDDTDDDSNSSSSSSSSSSSDSDSDAETTPSSIQQINLFEQLESLLKYIPNIYQVKIIQNGYNYNILQNYVEWINFKNSNFKTASKIANILQEIDKTKLYDYPKDNLRPIIMFIERIFYNINYVRNGGYLVSLSNINLVLQSLIDSNQIVLYQPVNTAENPSDIKKLPLYIILNNYFSIYKFYNPDNPIQLINTLIDKEQKVILTNTSSSPFKQYFEKILNLSKDELVYKNKDIFYKDVISTIMLNKEYIYYDTTGVERTYLYDLLSKIYEPPELSSNNIFLEHLDYFIKNKLLFDPEINGNQHVFNIINHEDRPSYGSILTMYVGSFKIFNCEIFKYLYNKQLLVLNPAPIFAYLQNRNCLETLDYNPLIIRLLIRNYNEVSPLSLIDKRSRYPLAFFLKIILNSKSDDILIRFITENPDSFEIIKLLGSDKRYIDKAKGFFVDIIEDFDIDKVNSNVVKILHYIDEIINS